MWVARLKKQVPQKGVFEKAEYGMMTPEAGFVVKAFEPRLLTEARGVEASPHFLLLPPSQVQLRECRERMCCRAQIHARLSSDAPSTGG